MTVDVFQTLRLYCHPTKQNCIPFFHFYMTTLLDPLLQPHYVIPWKNPPQGLYFPTSFPICHMCPFAKALVSQTEAYTCIWILEREGKEQKKEIEKWWDPKGQHIHCSPLQHRPSNAIALALIQCGAGLGRELWILSLSFFFFFRVYMRQLNYFCMLGNFVILVDSSWTSPGLLFL